MLIVQCLCLNLLVTMSMAAAQQRSNENDPLSPSERVSLISQQKLSSRARVYVEAAGRRLKEAAGYSAAGNSEGMAGALEAYGRILGLCLDEMKERTPDKKKDFKKPEITLRNYTKNLTNLQARVSLDDRASVETAIETTKQLRASFLTVIFGRVLNVPRQRFSKGVEP